jgi:hypothetical protein
MASLRSAGSAPLEVVVEVTETDHGKGRLVCFGALDNDGRTATLGAVVKALVDTASVGRCYYWAAFSSTRVRTFQIQAPPVQVGWKPSRSVMARSISMSRTCGVSTTTPALQ